MIGDNNDRFIIFVTDNDINDKTDRDIGKCDKHTHTHTVMVMIPL